jgi:hypothetical protein
MAWTGFMLLRLTSGWLLQTCKWTFGSHTLRSNLLVRTGTISFSREADNCSWVNTGFPPALNTTENG